MVSIRRFLPCKHCGMRYTQHAGLKRKCLFESTSFVAKKTKNLTAVERSQCLGRIRGIQARLLKWHQQREKQLETSFDLLQMALINSCPHPSEHVRDASFKLGRPHYYCDICETDWYRNDDR